MLKQVFNVSWVYQPRCAYHNWSTNVSISNETWPRFRLGLGTHCFYYVLVLWVFYCSRSLIWVLTCLLVQVKSKISDHIMCYDHYSRKTMFVEARCPGNWWSPLLPCFLQIRSNMCTTSFNESFIHESEWSFLTVKGGELTYQASYRTLILSISWYPSFKLLFLFLQ